MIEEHHALTIEAAFEILNFGHDKPLLRTYSGLASIVNNVSIKQMKKWVAQADELDDVVISKGLANKIIDKVSKATSFQHFAYCGLLGKELRSGSAVIRKYNGYCWDCDPYLKWYEEIANASWANVSYNADCHLFNPATLHESPGARRISGNMDWDNQLYPSAIELAEFYGRTSLKLKNHDQNWDIQSLCFAIHMLHDLSVPHHVLNTIENDHRGYEQKILDFWSSMYSNRSSQKKQDVFNRQILDMISAMLNDLRKVRKFEDIGKWAVNQTRKRLERTSGIPKKPDGNEALNVTAQAIACTIKAFDLYRKGKIPARRGVLRHTGFWPKVKNAFGSTKSFQMVGQIKEDIIR